MIIRKDELVRAVSQKANLSKASSKAAVDAFLDAITEALQAGNTVQLPKFGTFEVKDRPARQGRDITHNKIIDIPASKALKFKASGTWKTKLQ